MCHLQCREWRTLELDSAYFSRYFRKQTGMTPGEFRESAHRDLMLGP